MIRDRLLSESEDDLDGDIPEDIEKAIDEILSGKDRPNVRNPKRFENDGRDDSEVLPEEDENGNPIDYTEHDVNPKPPKQPRDGRRVVTGGDGSVYYTTDHYKTFIRVR